jgi:hypothetical protein
LTLAAGQPTRVQLGVVAAVPDATAVSWQVASGPPGLRVTPSSGTLTLAAGSATLNPTTGRQLACRPAAPATQTLTVAGSAPGTSTLRVDLRTTSGAVLPAVVLDVTVQP